MGALIDQAFDTLIFFILEMVTTLLWLVNLIELGFVQVTHFFHKWVLDALPDIFQAFLTAVEELIVVFVVLAAIGLLLLRIVKYVFPATAHGMPLFQFATRWFLISFLLGAPVVIIQQVDQWRISFGQDIRNATTAAMGVPLLPALPGNVFTIYDIDGCPVWTIATPPCIEIGDVTASFVGVETLADLDTALPPAFSAGYFPYGDTTTFSNLSDSERSDAINLARDGMFRMGLGILPNFLAGLDALLWIFLTFAFLFVYLALPITLPLAFFQRTEQFAINTLMRGGELFIETGISAAFLGIITYALIAAANISDLVFVGLAFFALFPVGWRFLSAVKTTNHSIGGMSVGSGAAVAATSSATRGAAGVASAGMTEMAHRGLAAVGAVEQKVDHAVQAGGKAARVAGGAALVAYAARAGGGESRAGQTPPLTAAAGGALLGASQRATTGLTLGYLATEGRDDVAADTQSALRSAVIGTQLTRNPAWALLLNERQRGSINGAQRRRPDGSGGGPSPNGGRSGSGPGSGPAPAPAPPSHGGRPGHRNGRRHAAGSGQDAFSADSARATPAADGAGGSAPPPQPDDRSGAIRFSNGGTAAITMQARALASPFVESGAHGDLLDRLPAAQRSRATRARPQLQPVLTMPSSAADGQFAAATAAVAEAVTADVAARRAQRASDTDIADQYRSASGILSVSDRLATDNPYRVHPTAVRAVADAVLEPTRRIERDHVVAAIYATAEASEPDAALANHLGVAELGELGGKARLLRRQIEDSAIPQPVMQAARRAAATGDFEAAAEQLASNGTLDQAAARRTAVVLANLPAPDAPAYLDDAPVDLSTGPAPFAAHYADQVMTAFADTGQLPPIPARLPPARQRAAAAVHQIAARSDTAAAVPSATREAVAAIRHETRALQHAGYGNRQIVERLRTDDGIAAITDRLAADNPYRTAPDAVQGLVATAIQPRTTAPPEMLLNAVYDTLHAPNPHAALAAQLSAANINMTPEQAARQTAALRRAVTTHAIPRETLVRAGAHATDGDLNQAATVIATGSRATSADAHAVGVLLSDLPPLYRAIAIGPELPPVAASPAPASATAALLPRPAAQPDTDRSTS